LQSWEVLDPPSGWDTSGPVLATGYYNISSTALQMVMLIDDAMAQACHQGERCLEAQDSTARHSTGQHQGQFQIRLDSRLCA